MAWNESQQFRPWSDVFSAWKGGQRAWGNLPSYSAQNVKLTLSALNKGTQICLMLQSLLQVVLEWVKRVPKHLPFMVFAALGYMILKKNSFRTNPSLKTYGSSNHSSNFPQILGTPPNLNTRTTRLHTYDYPMRFSLGGPRTPDPRDVPWFQWSPMDQLKDPGGGTLGFGTKTNDQPWLQPWKTNEFVPFLKGRTFNRKYIDSNHPFSGDVLLVLGSVCHLVGGWTNPFEKY